MVKKMAKISLLLEYDCPFCLFNTVQEPSSVPKYKAPINFAGKRLTTLTMIFTYNVSTKFV
jgi:hypothetical protein